MFLRLFFSSSLIAICTLPFLIACSHSQHKDDKKNERKKPIEHSYNVMAAGLNVPWDLLLINDSTIWTTNHFPNNIIEVNTSTSEIDTIWIKDDQVDSIDNCLLMGIEKHPRFHENQTVYATFNFVMPDDPKTMGLFCKIYRFDSLTNRLYPGKLVVDSIATKDSYLPGGRMKITRDSFLLLATSNEKDLNMDSRDPSSLSGKFLRFDLEGNPAGNYSYEQDPVFAIGLRNPQGIAETAEGKLFFCDHGPTTDDKVGIIQEKGDFGWPDVLGYCDDATELEKCQNENFIHPLKAWTPTVAPGALAYYHHNLYPQLSNCLLLATLKESDLRILQLNEDQDSITSEQVILDNRIGRVRDIAINSEGRIFLISANQIPKSFKYNTLITKDSLDYDVLVELKIDELGNSSIEN